MNYPNIYALFRERAEHYRGRGDVFHFRREGRWQGFPWARFEEESHAFAAALVARGLTRGAAVCVLMGNVPEWPVADVGTIAAGGVGVGLYPSSSPEQCRYIVEHSDAEFVLVDTAAQLSKILSVREGLPKVRAVVSLDSEASRCV